MERTEIEKIFIFMERILQDNVTFKIFLNSIQLLKYLIYTHMIACNMNNCQRRYIIHIYFLRHIEDGPLSFLIFPN